MAANCRCRVVSTGQQRAGRKFACSLHFFLPIFFSSSSSSSCLCRPDMAANKQPLSLAGDSSTPPRSSAPALQPTADTEGGRQAGKGTVRAGRKIVQGALLSSSSGVDAASTSTMLSAQRCSSAPVYMLVMVEDAMRVKVTPLRLRMRGRQCEDGGTLSLC